jgi:hypothetical protein
VCLPDRADPGHKRTRCLRRLDRAWSAALAVSCGRPSGAPARSDHPWRAGARRPDASPARGHHAPVDMAERGPTEVRQRTAADGPTSSRTSPASDSAGGRTVPALLGRDGSRRAWGSQLVRSSTWAVAPASGCCLHYQLPPRGVLVTMHPPGIGRTRSSFSS